MEPSARVQDGPSPLLPASLSAADTLLWDALPHLHLNIAQTASLCGISVRQLGYWSKQGYVTASGQGARRMYGLDSLRRVLAIKDAMTSGVSLRQALRALPDAADSAVPFPSDGALAPSSPAATAEAPHPSSFLSPKQIESLSQELMALFAANRHTRDDVAGLAVKVGRATSDIRTIADKLCAQGALVRTVLQTSVVFEGVQKGGL